MKNLFTAFLLLTLNSFSLWAKDTEPANNTFAGADTLIFPVTDTAYVQPAGDADFFTVHVSQCGVLLLNLTNIPGLNMEMTAYSSATTDSVIGYSGYGGNRTLELAVSPGDYYIKADDHFNVTSATPYLITVAFDANDAGECNQDFATAHILSDSTIFTAEIRGTNALRSPVTDLDFYKVHVSTCGTLGLNLINIPGLNLEMTVFSSAVVDSAIGYSGYGGNRSLALSVSAGDYYIKVDDHFNVTSATGYSLIVAFDSSDIYECNNGFADASPLPDNITLSAEMRGTNALRNPVIDVDYYKVQITQCGTLLLNLTNIPGLNLEMTAYLGSDVDSVLGYSGYGGNRTLELSVSAGDIYIKVDDHFSTTSTTAYGLSVAFDSSDVYECNNTFADASPIPDNITLSAEMRGSNALRTPVKDVDYYKVHISQCGILTLNLTNIPGLNLEMTAYRGANVDSVLGYSGYGGNRTLEMAVSAGDIYIKVDDHFSVTSASAYSLAVAFDSSDVYECNNSFADASPVPDSILINAKIRGTNNLNIPVIDVDYYKVSIPRCGVLVLNLTNVPGDNLEMTVYSAPYDSTSIGYSGYGGNRNLELLVSEGTYYIKVDDHFNSTSANPYTLAVSFDSTDACECNNTFAMACSIPISTTFNAKIRGTNSTYIPTTDVDYYTFSSSLCGQLIINLTNIPGLNIEMTAFLTADSTASVAYSGYGGNRSITLSTPGSYYLKVDDHFNSTSANAYTLAFNFAPNPAVPVITPAGPVVLCPGQEVILHSSAATNNFWSTGETVDSIIVTSAGIYTDTVHGANGCVAPSLPVTVTALSSPIAAFTYSNTNNVYTFIITAVNATSYEWKFGNDDTSTQADPVYTFHGSGIDSVTLVVYNDCGSDSVVHVLDVIDGTRELKPGSHFLVAPVPCTTCELIGKMDSKDLQVTDLAGRTCPVSFTKTARGYTLDLPASGSGVYFIRNLKTGEVVKFVKE